MSGPKSIYAAEGTFLTVQLHRVIYELKKETEII
jgi:hypothetical protein